MNPVTAQGLDQSYVSETSYDAIRCSPRLQMPAGLQSVNIAWSSCIDTMEAHDDGYVNDPLWALIPATALGSAQAEETSPTSTAAPISLTSQTLPKKTSPPS